MKVERLPERPAWCAGGGERPEKADMLTCCDVRKRIDGSAARPLLLQ